ncbi:MAG: serine protease [candidate division Zixibacteria bacterium]|nr:serine protease [candidate division Zixibacteria bacterium]
MIQDFRKAVAGIEKSVFGIGDHTGPQFRIFGTGFVIREDGWLMTNRHVLEPLLLKDGDGNISISPASRALQFVVTIRDQSGARQIGWANSRIVELVWMSQPNIATPMDVRDDIEIDGQKADLVLAPEPPDIGICKIDLSLLPPECLPLKPVRFKRSLDLLIGTPVGCLGYPQGIQGPVSTKSIMDLQCCPILQTGCISAILPHPDFPNPTQFLLDIFVNGGSSGSPLMNSDGEILGVVFAARQQFTQLQEMLPDGKLKPDKTKGVWSGTAIGCAIPSSAFIDSLSRVLPGAP